MMESIDGLNHERLIHGDGMIELLGFYFFWMEELVVGVDHSER